MTTTAHKYVFILLGSLTNFAYAQYNFPQKMVISVPVTDLRFQPISNTAQLPAGPDDNPLQITQLLLGEHIMAQEERIDENNVSWLRINSLQQEFFYEPLEWHGFPGWIQADHAVPVEQYPNSNLAVKSYVADLYDNEFKQICSLSLGTRLWGQKYNQDVWEIILPTGSKAYIKDTDVYFFDETIHESIQDLRTSIVNTAHKFVGNWYSWGGRSAQHKDFSISSVDCSALVNLSFMAHGLQLPRMSHEQFLRSTRIESCSDLQPGDLIFFSTITKNPMRMDHVMMFVGDDTLIEATHAGNHSCRVVSFSERMGQPCPTIKNGDIVYDRDTAFHVFFGTFFEDRSLLQSLRHDAIKNQYSLTYMNKRNMPQDCNYCKYH